MSIVILDGKPRRSADTLGAPSPRIGPDAACEREQRWPRPGQLTLFTGSTDAWLREMAERHGLGPEGSR